MSQNRDEAVIKGFGDEWSRFDQRGLDPAEHEELFESYFGIFPWKELPAGAQGFDLGCGSGRWAKLAAPKVGRLYCVDASGDALAVARESLKDQVNCEMVHAGVGELPFEDGSMDFGYSLGVLHHVPDTAAGIRACVSKLKQGAPFLLYLYYAFDNRPFWYRGIWEVSDLLRKGVSRLPHSARYAASQALAGAVYFPLARMAWLAHQAGLPHANDIPLAFYKDRSFYTMRTDALDRFGTRLEQRFTREEIRSMMEAAGLHKIKFSDSSPYWVALGIKA